MNIFAISFLLYRVSLSQWQLVLWDRENSLILCFPVFFHQFQLHCFLSLSLLWNLIFTTYAYIFFLIFTHFLRWSTFSGLLYLWMSWTLLSFSSNSLFLLLMLTFLAKFLEMPPVLCVSMKIWKNYNGKSTF